MSFVNTVGRHGIEELLIKGYNIKEIAQIYGISLATMYLTLCQLYGHDWKNFLKRKLSAEIVAE